MTQIDSIESLGHPLGFKVAAGAARPGVMGTSTSRDVITVEARQLEGHQKEGVVTEGESGSVWRLTTDEDGHLRGTDLAPFPLGYFNAGLHGDLTNRIVSLAGHRSIEIADMSLSLNTGYWMTGSFFRGRAEGFAAPAAIDVTFDSPAGLMDLDQLVRDAVAASPAFALMRIPLRNTFAIYVNGQRRVVRTMLASPSADAPDPFVTYSAPPVPLETDQYFGDLVYKTGVKSEGVPQVAPGEMKTKAIRPVIGSSHLLEVGGAMEADVVLGIPGVSHSH